LIPPGIFLGRFQFALSELSALPDSSFICCVDSENNNSVVASAPEEEMELGEALKVEENLSLSLSSGDWQVIPDESSSDASWTVQKVSDLSLCPLSPCCALPQSSFLIWFYW
jgi:hypothetical protein